MHSAQTARDAAALNRRVIGATFARCASGEMSDCRRVARDARAAAVTTAMATLRGEKKTKGEHARSFDDGDGGASWRREGRVAHTPLAWRSVVAHTAWRHVARHRRQRRGDTRKRTRTHTHTPPLGLAWLGAASSRGGAARRVCPLLPRRAPARRARARAARAPGTNCRRTSEACRRTSGILNCT